MGLATDGDADRLGVISDDGQFISTLQVLPLLLLHVYRNRGWGGAVAHTFSQSQLVGRLASALDLEVFEVPIGFKNIAALMLRQNILIGGEESGGIGLSRHLPERDGLFIQLLLLDLLAATRKSLTQLIQEMWREFGELHYDRRDLDVPFEQSARLLETLKDQPPEHFFGHPIRKCRLWTEPSSCWRRIAGSYSAGREPNRSSGFTVKRPPRPEPLRFCRMVSDSWNNLPVPVSLDRGCNRGSARPFDVKYGV